MIQPRSTSLGMLAVLCIVVVASAPGADGGPPTTATWQLAFSDDFDGIAINPEKWMTPWSHADRTQNWRNVGWSWELMDDDNVQVANGSCKILAQKEGDSWKSGVIQTCPTFQQKYGFFEARLKVARGFGYLSAFWLACDNAWPPEIDIVETLGHEPQKAYMTTHYTKDNASYQSTVIGPDLSADFHIYSVEWDEQQIVYRLDQKEVGRHQNTAGFLSIPMFMLLNIHIGNSWAGHPTDTAAAAMEIDWVRAWRKTADGDTTPP